MEHIVKLRDLPTKLAKLHALLPNMKLVGSVALLLHAVNHINNKHPESDHLIYLVNDYLTQGNPDFDIVVELQYKYEDGNPHIAKLQKLVEAGYHKTEKVRKEIHELDQGDIEKGISLKNADEDIEIDYIGEIPGMGNLKKKRNDDESVYTFNNDGKTIEITIEGLSKLDYGTIIKDGMTRKEEIKTFIMKLLKVDKPADNRSKRLRNNEPGEPGLARRLFGGSYKKKSNKKKRHCKKSTKSKRRTSKRKMNKRKKSKHR